MILLLGCSPAAFSSSSGADGFESSTPDSRFSLLLPMRLRWRLKMLLRFCVPEPPVTRCVAHLIRFVGAERSGCSGPRSLFGGGGAAIIGLMATRGRPREQGIVSCGETAPWEAQEAGGWDDGCYVLATNMCTPCLWWFLCLAGARRKLWRAVMDAARETETREQRR